MLQLEHYLVLDSSLSGFVRDLECRCSVTTTRGFDTEVPQPYSTRTPLHTHWPPALPSHGCLCPPTAQLRQPDTHWSVLEHGHDLHWMAQDKKTAILVRVWGRHGKQRWGGQFLPPRFVCAVHKTPKLKLNSCATACPYRYISSMGPYIPFSLLKSCVPPQRKHSAWQSYVLHRKYSLSQKKKTLHLIKQM